MGLKRPKDATELENKPLGRGDGDRTHSQSREKSFLRHPGFTANVPPHSSVRCHPHSSCSSSSGPPSARCSAGGIQTRVPQHLPGPPDPATLGAAPHEDGLVRSPSRSRHLQQGKHGGPTSNLPLRGKRPHENRKRVTLAAKHLSGPSQQLPPPQGGDQWDLSISRLTGFLGWVEVPQGSA